MDEGSGLPLPDHGLHAGAAKWTREALPHAKPSAALLKPLGFRKDWGPPTRLAASTHTERPFPPALPTHTAGSRQSPGKPCKAPASPPVLSRAHGGGLCAPAEVGKSKLGAVGPGLRPLVSRFSPAWVSCL